MLAIDDVRLIKDQLIKIKRSTYFEKSLVDHSEALIELAVYLEENEGSIDDAIVKELGRILFIEQMFLRGSVSGEVPYEVVLSLKLALDDWGHKTDIITTALLDDPQFYFRFSPGVWHAVANTLPSYALPASQYSLIQIAFPRLYRSMPLMAIPLYHELGHFIDLKNHVSHVARQLATLNGLPEQALPPSHFREHFADLFAACYCGEAFNRVLDFLAAGNGTSASHPATSDRLKLLTDFLAGKSLSLVDVFQQALSMLGRPQLSIRYSVPDADTYLDNIRPVILANTNEVHGIYVAGYTYLEKIRTNPSGPWLSQSPKDVLRVINDLVEKSIRNYDVISRWKNVNP